MLPHLFAVAAMLGCGLPAFVGEAVSIAPRGRQPRVAVSSKGLVAIVYGEGAEIFSRISNDAGATYAEATRVGSVAQLMLGMRRGPQVAAAGPGLVVTVIGKQGDLVAFRSADAGRSWTGPVTLNDSPTSAREGLHDLAAGADGSVHVVWLDLRDGRTKVFGARSPDQGLTWEANRAVYASPERTVCECCQPTVAADGRDEVVVLWRNSLAGARDMFLIRSQDGGRSFGGAARLGSGSWLLKGCPMDGGGVAASSGRVATVWRREEILYAAEPGGEEKPLGPGRNPDVAFSSSGPLFAWQTPEGDVVLKKTGADAPVTVGHGRFPSFGAAPAGPVVLAWEDPDRGAVARPVP
jgi:hypothetical protein